MSTQSLDGKTRDRLTRKDDVNWVNASDIPLNSTVLSVNTSEVRQTLLGFGGALTDSAAFVFNTLEESAQEQVLDMLFGDDGNKLTLARVPIGPSDFAASVYSYDELESKDDTDYGMENFSVDHDEAYILPMITRALAKATASGRSLRVLASPWTAPSWLKRNKAVRNSLNPGLVQTEDAKQAYALYLTEFLDAYESRGVPVWAMTVQNEPHVAGQFAFTYPCMGFEGSDEGEFLGQYLGPALEERTRSKRKKKQRRERRVEEKEEEEEEEEGLLVFVHDDQKAMDTDPDFMLNRVNDILAAAAAGNNSTSSSPFVHGVAFHWYGANLHNYDALATLHAQHPSLQLLATEATLKWPSARKWEQAFKYAIDIVGDLNEWTAGWIEWNVLLDGSGGPTCIGPSVDTDYFSSTSCEWPKLHNETFGACDAPLRAVSDPSTGETSIHVGDQYFIMGHFSRFLPPGSKVVASSLSSLETPPTPKHMPRGGEGGKGEGRTGSRVASPAPPDEAAAVSPPRWATLFVEPSKGGGDPVGVFSVAALTPDGGAVAVVASNLDVEVTVYMALVGLNSTASTTSDLVVGPVLIPPRSIATLMAPS